MELFSIRIQRTFQLVSTVKGVKEPLKQGQQEATPAQRRNYRSCKKSNSKGVKV